MKYKNLYIIFFVMLLGFNQAMAREFLKVIEEELDVRFHRTSSYAEERYLFLELVCMDYKFAESAKKHSLSEDVIADREQLMKKLDDEYRSTQMLFNVIDSSAGDLYVVEYIEEDNKNLHSWPVYYACKINGEYYFFSTESTDVGKVFSRKQSGHDYVDRSNEIYLRIKKGNEPANEP